MKKRPFYRIWHNAQYTRWLEIDWRLKYVSVCIAERYFALNRNGRLTTFPFRSRVDA